MAECDCGEEINQRGFHFPECPISRERLEFSPRSGLYQPSAEDFMNLVRRVERLETESETQANALYRILKAQNGEPLS